MILLKKRYETYSKNINSKTNKKLTPQNVYFLINTTSKKYPSKVTPQEPKNVIDSDGSLTGASAYNQKML